MLHRTYIQLHKYKSMIILLTRDRHFSSLHFTSLHFTARRFTLLRCTSIHFTSHHFASLQFTSLHFTSLHVTLLHCTSCPTFLIFLHLITRVPFCKTYKKWCSSLWYFIQSPVATFPFGPNTFPSTLFSVILIVQRDSKRLIQFHTSLFPELYMVCEWST